MGMHQRCSNPKAPHYERYGGRGIRVCKRWSVFMNFFKDMGRRPSPNHSIDRIDNDGDYTPSNCRWLLQPQQMRNRANSVKITWRGRTASVGEWSKRVGIPEYTIRRRLDRGWDARRVLFTPNQPVGSPKRHA